MSRKRHKTALSYRFFGLIALYYIAVNVTDGDGGDGQMGEMISVDA